MIQKSNVTKITLLLSVWSVLIKAGQYSNNVIDTETSAILFTTSHIIIALHC